MAEFKRPETGPIRDIKFGTTVMCGPKQLNQMDNPAGVHRDRRWTAVLIDPRTQNVWLCYEDKYWTCIPWSEVRYVAYEPAPEPPPAA